jgi:F-type H+-transporting ATPase subunit a
MLFFSPIEKFDVVNLAFFKIANVVDFSITSMSLYLIFSVVTLIFFLSFFNFNSTFVPSFTQICVEQSVALVFGVLDKQAGRKGYIYFPFVLTLFFFILLSNLYGITPFSFAPTSHIVITFFFLLWFGLWLFSLGF